jgi:hypothetical protein
MHSGRPSRDHHHAGLGDSPAALAWMLDDDADSYKAWRPDAGGRDLEQFEATFEFCGGHA